MMDTVLELRSVVKRFGDFTAVAGIDVAVDKGEIVALLGPSGCGKTTSLRMVAGFEKPDEGQVLIEGKDVSDHRPHERSIGLVFQDYALFPHMSVGDNIAFGMKHRGVDRDRIPERTREILALVELSGLEGRRPRELSGGQQQRVALARALVTKPAVMLLDEPLSNLDAKLRQDLRVQMRQILNSVGTTAILVTHDQVEAMSVADRILVMNEGRIVQEGDADTLYQKPNSRFVADFFGHVNWLDGEIVDDSGAAGGFRLPGGETIPVPIPPGLSRALIGLRPERLRLSPTADSKRLNATLETIEYLGPDIELRARASNGQRLMILDRNVGGEPPRVGSEIAVYFQPGDCIVVPADGG
jgi:ABC-type Fe3+/spermidine/putrescine transport system ATPase subunit